jgi:nitroreductase
VEFTEVPQRRRMVRHYRPDPVPDDTQRRIVQVVRHAPSAGFSQGPTAPLHAGHGSPPVSAPTGL